MKIIFSLQLFLFQSTIDNASVLQMRLTRMYQLCTINCVEFMALGIATIDIFASEKKSDAGVCTYQCKRKISDKNFELSRGNVMD